MCIGFPSTLLYKIRGKLITDENNINIIEQIDRATFYYYFAGIYKDPRKDVQDYFYYGFLFIAIGLVIERQAINWLTNRKGCTFNRLQKFIELDCRMKAINEKWPIINPKYDINAYEDHYFFHDF